MSLYIENSIQASKSHTNCSPAKMTYSFSKTNRFPLIDPICKSHFYATKEGISYTLPRDFGYGKREVFTDKGIIAQKQKHHLLINILLIQYLSPIKKQTSTHSAFLVETWKMFTNY